MSECDREERCVKELVGYCIPIGDTESSVLRDVVQISSMNLHGRIVPSHSSFGTGFVFILI